MQERKEKGAETEAKLYLIATPIGNLQDITLRALEVLRSVGIVACEDTRRGRQLLSHFEIHARLLSYHSFNEHEKTAGLLDMVEEGVSIAFISDAGTPSLADPGFLLVRDAVARGMEVEVIPGVSALTFAVTAAGLPVDRFSFFGFAPVKSGRKRSFFEQLAAEDKTVFFYESPHRIEKTLVLMAELLEETRPVVVIREATKIFEERLRGSAREILEATANRKWKGELVIAVGPSRNRDRAEFE